MQLRTVIFDLDGTLLDTLNDIADSANAVLAARGYPTHRVDAFRQMVGDGVRMLMQRALPQNDHSTSLLDDVAAQFRDEYAQRWHATTQPYAGVPALLADLQKAGLQLAVLSNKPHEFTLRCVERYFPDVDFASVVGQREGHPRKPDPAVAWQILEQAQCPREEAVLIGDSATDMETAVSAAVRPWGVRWGFRNQDELRQAGAERVFTQPGEILAAVRECGQIAG